MNRRRVAYYGVAALFGGVILAADRLIGENAVTYVLLGFLPAFLVGVVLPFALLGRKPLRRRDLFDDRRRVQSIEPRE